jgi:hypothetical protein
VEVYFGGLWKMMAVVLLMLGVSSMLIGHFDAT